MAPVCWLRITNCRTKRFAKPATGWKHKLEEQVRLCCRLRKINFRSRQDQSIPVSSRLRKLPREKNFPLHNIKGKIASHDSRTMKSCNSFRLFCHFNSALDEMSEMVAGRHIVQKFPVFALTLRARCVCNNPKSPTRWRFILRRGFQSFQKVWVNRRRRRRQRRRMNGTTTTTQ